VVFKLPSTLAAEFDEIAEAERAAGKGESLSSAERFIVGKVPAGAGSLVDVGCGSGRLTRAAARRVRRALGIDLSPRMIESARSRTPPDAAIEYRVSDVMTEELREAPFDVVLALNLVHHAPLADVVRRLVDVTAPGGTLLIQDVVDRPGVRYAPLNAAALVWNVVAQPRAARAVRALYISHGEGETYLTPREVAARYASLLPGGQIHHHLSWRYSIVWTKPLGS
jgi:2-polyprenyl-3-methyl-5-hydroxy-6-metoxy-1,4-benzoquinol methylase